MTSSLKGTLGAWKVVLYTLPDGSWTQRDAIRDKITDGGVRSWTTKLTGTRASRLVAWAAVRGNPSRINEAVGDTDGGFDPLVRSQPLDLNSKDMRSRIVESGTRFPDWIAVSTLRPWAIVRIASLTKVSAGRSGEYKHINGIPSSVLLRTFSRNRSPELIEAN